MGEEEVGQGVWFIPESPLVFIPNYVLYSFTRNENKTITYTY